MSVAHPPHGPVGRRVSEKKEREEEKRIQHLRSLRFFAPGRGRASSDPVDSDRRLRANVGSVTQPPAKTSGARGERTMG